jgi:hypothetical protein
MDRGRRRSQFTSPAAAFDAHLCRALASAFCSLGAQRQRRLQHDGLPGSASATERLDDLS